MNNNRLSKIMLNYRSNGRRRLGSPLKRISDEVEMDLSRPNWWQMMIMIMIMMISNVDVAKIFFIIIYGTESMYSMLKDKLHNFSLNQFE
jgi:hypothetical protein